MKFGLCAGSLSDDWSNFSGKLCDKVVDLLFECVVCEVMAKELEEVSDAGASKFYISTNMYNHSSPHTQATQPRLVDQGRNPRPTQQTLNTCFSSMQRDATRPSFGPARPMGAVYSMPSQACS
jgi:hypothetical protein